MIYLDTQTAHPHIAGQPSATIPGAVGHEASGQWSSASRPHQPTPKISLDWRAKKMSIPIRATPASKAADKT